MADTGMVFIVDDDASICELIASALGREGLKVRTFPSAEAFVDANARTDDPSFPCCLLLDLVLPGQAGLEFLEKHFKRVSCPVIIITAHGSIQNAVKSMKLGALDFLEKPFSTEALKKVVFEALKGDRCTDFMVRRRLATLSPPERELLEDIVAGRSTRVVAGRLGISRRTIDHRRDHLMYKMRANNVADLVRMTMQVRV